MGDCPPSSYRVITARQSKHPIWKILNLGSKIVLIYKSDAFPREGKAYRQNGIIGRKLLI